MSVNEYTKSGNEVVMEEIKNKSKFTTKQWLMLSLLSIINFGSANVASLMAPFFPAEAEKKGASATEYGFIFGVFQLVIFLVSPIYGKYMVNIGPKFLLNTGIFTLSICCFLFGLLDKMYGRNVFVCYALIIRMIQGLGHAGFLTGSLTLIAKEFHNNVPAIFSLIQTVYGIGILCGPTIGSLLYELGGFITPFITVGSFLFVTACLTFFVMPNYDKDDENKVERPQFFNILRIPSISVSVFTTFSGACALGFLAANLEPHLRQFGLKPTVVGVIFVVGSLCYSITAPLWGRLCRQVEHTKTLSGIAALIICVAYTLIGPAPFIPLDSLLWLSIVALCLHGFGVAGEIVCSFLGNLKEAKARGYPDTLSTFGLMSSLWASSMALGGFLGPSLGGMLLDYVGFRTGTLFIIGQHGLVAVINLGYGYHLNRKNRRNIEECDKSETSTLLHHQTTTLVNDKV